MKKRKIERHYVASPQFIQLRSIYLKILNQRIAFNSIFLNLNPLPSSIKNHFSSILTLISNKNNINAVLSISKQTKLLLAKVITKNGIFTLLLRYVIFFAASLFISIKAKSNLANHNENIWRNSK